MKKIIKPGSQRPYNHKIPIPDEDLWHYPDEESESLNKKIGTNVIYFYMVREDHGYMSNFAFYPIKINGIKYKTSEHYFQSMKFFGTKWEKEIRETNRPKEAATLGRNKTLPLRKDWESVKDNVMRVAVKAKFDQHPDIARQLVATGDAKLIERTTDDYYWGCGTDGHGKNMLGIILMEVRDKLNMGKNVNKL